MRRLLPALLLLVMMRPAWGHPMPSSSVVLRVHRTGIDAELTLPIGELAMGWEKPLPRDAVRTVQQYGEEIKDYVRAHVRPTAPDGRPWTVTVREVTPVVEQEPDVRVALTMTPPPGAPADRLTFHYDVIFHHLITHTAVVTLASDWRNGVTGERAGAAGDDARHQCRDRHRPLRGELVPGIRRDVPPRRAPHRRGDRPPAVPARPDPPRAARRGGRALGRLCRRADGPAADRQGRDRVHPRPLDHARDRRAGMGAPARRRRRIGHCAVDPGLGRPCPGPDLPGPGSLHRRRLRAGARPGVRGDADRTSGSIPGRWSRACWASISGSRPSSSWSSWRRCPGSCCWPARASTGRSASPGPTLTGIAAAAWFAERAFGWVNPIAPLVETVASHALWLLAGLVVLTVAATVASDELNASQHGQTIPRTSSSSIFDF